MTTSVEVEVMLHPFARQMTPLGHPDSSNHSDVLTQTVRSIRDITNTININVQQREWSRSTDVNSR